MFPQKFQSTTSHWQATNRGPTSLWNHGRDDALPPEADYVIIGAGATGAALAYHLTLPGGAGAGKTVVVLEAKDVASGASGRNGGHVAPRSWNMLGTMTRPLAAGGAGLSAADAVDVYFFEMENLDYVEEVVAREGLDADFWRGRRLEVFTTAAGAARNAETRAHFLAAQDRTRHRGRRIECEMLSGADAARAARMRTATHVNTVPAGSWHPHRGVTGLMRRALDAGARLFSWTPVVRLERAERAEAGAGWAVDCGERGTITAANVVLATNGYTRYLAEGDLAKHVVPYRGHCGIVVPPTTYAGPRALDATYGVEDGPYLIQTPHSGLVLGPYNATVISQQLSGAAELYGVDDDSVVLPRLRDWIASWCKDSFDGWGPEGPGEGVARVWSGVMGHSVDWVPLYGPVPGKDGLWAAAGYNGGSLPQAVLTALGHGMATILNATRYLAQHMKSGKWAEGLPRCFEITEERLQKARQAMSPLDY